MYIILVRTLLVLLVSLSGYAWGANFSDPIDGVFKGTYGNSISVEVPSLVTKSPVTGNQNGDLSFVITSDTAYKNFNQLTDLQNGDSVRVEYSEDKNDQMVATAITRLAPQVVDNPVNTNTVVTTAPATQTVTTTTTQVGAQ